MLWDLREPIASPIGEYGATSLCRLETVTEPVAVPCFNKQTTT
jgi:hypothetical protein